MWKKIKWKEVIIVVMMTAMILIMLYDFVFTQLQHNRQIIVAKMMTEEASKSDDILYDDLRVYVKDKLTPGDTYQLTIDFQVINRRGDRFLVAPVKQTGNLANLSCVKLEYSEKFVATKEYIQVYLQMALINGEIVDDNGNVVNFKKQKLAPVITIEKEIGD